MARTKKQEPVKETATVVTRAEKKDATKNLIKECLAVKPLKHNELLEAVAKLYKERFGGEDTENINDVKGRVGSVLDIMKKDGDVAYEGGMYALKARSLPEPPVQKEEKAVEETPKKPAKKTAKKEVVEEVKEEKTEEKPVKKTAKKAKATKKEPLPPAPLQPIAPVAPVTPEVAPEPIPEEKKTEPKKRGRKAKTVETPAVEPAKVDIAPVVETEAAPVVEKVEEKSVEKAVEAPVEVVQPVPAPVVEEKAETGLVVKEKAPIVKKEVIDVSFFLGTKTSTKTPTKEKAKETASIKEAVKESAKEQVKTPVKTEKQPEKVEKKAEIKEEKPAPKTEAPKTEKKPETKPVQKAQPHNVRKLSENGLHHVKKPVQRPQTADERLCEAFLKRIRSLGGDYFEYYSVYLLERYSLKNGRRLEGLRISGGDHDGGIDGEIELTDKMGFKETIYIQSKNWNPEKGDEKLWVVGETLLQQFIGACACRQAKDGKQNCRGIFVTTSRFTPEAKRILDTMSDKIVGYDGSDLYEAAKECSFGVVQKNGAWVLDEKLLSGSKAFFNLY